MDHCGRSLEVELKPSSALCELSGNPQVRVGKVKGSGGPEQRRRQGLPAMDVWRSGVHFLEAALPCLGRAWVGWRVSARKW